MTTKREGRRSFDVFMCSRVFVFSSPAGASLPFDMYGWKARAARLPQHRHGIQLDRSRLHGRIHLYDACG